MCIFHNIPRACQSVFTEAWCFIQTLAYIYFALFMHDMKVAHYSEIRVSFNNIPSLWVLFLASSKGKLCQCKSFLQRPNAGVL